MNRYKYIPICLFVFLFYVTSQIIASEDVVTIVYHANDQVFSFENTHLSSDEENAYPDLFVETKELLPGDSVKQEIIVKLENYQENETVNIYVQAMNNNEEYKALLNQISVSVLHEEEEISKKLNEAILLGSFTSNGTTSMILQLELPLTLGNEIEDIYATTEWVFSAEVITTNTPQTFDQSYVKAYSVLFILSCVSLCIWMKIKYKQ